MGAAKAKNVRNRKLRISASLLREIFEFTFWAAGEYLNQQRPSTPVWQEERRSRGAEERSRGAEEQRSGGAEERRSGGAEEQRSRGAEGQRSRGD
jgi:hypothetical protein